jgi:hypothetical protein
VTGPPLRRGSKINVSARSTSARNCSHNLQVEEHVSWLLNIGSVAGTVVRLHITFVPFLAWIFASSYATSGAATAWNSLVFMVLLFVCVLPHEFGNIFTARAFAAPTPYVTLLPIGGVAQLDRIPGGTPHRDRP